MELNRLLTMGWTETIKFKDEFGKTHYRDSFQEPLIAQLAEEVSQPRAPRGSDGSKNANKSTSSMPGNEQALFLLEETHEALAETRKLLNLSLRYEADDKRFMLGELAQRTPDQDALKECVAILARRVKAARILLGYETEKIELANAECEECGGTLVVARDVSTDVMCVGADEIRGCGKRYRRRDFVKLLEGKKYLVDTAAAVLWTGRPIGTLQRWRHEGRVTKHGQGKPGQVRWDLRELPQAVEGEPLPPPPPLPNARTHG